MSSTRGRLLAGFLCFGSVETTTDAEVWREAISQRYPGLFACIVPESLANRALPELPPGATHAVACTHDPLVSDGCSVSVVAVPASRVVAVVLAGGLGGTVDRVLGPFNRDASDF